LLRAVAVRVLCWLSVALESTQIPHADPLPRTSCCEVRHWPCAHRGL